MSAITVPLKRVVCRRLPSFWRFLVYRGWAVDNKWTELPDTKFDNYLKEDHPDRRWFVDWVISMAPVSVLEIGGGSLHELRQFHRKEALGKVSYTVLDAAKNFLKRGKIEFPSVKFVEGTVNKMKFADSSFDIVYCRAVLEHQPYYERPLKEMFRVSKDLVVVNLFRWSHGEDWIRQGKYFSNAYNINKFLRMFASLSSNWRNFLVLRGREPGPNIYEDDNIRRTGDHLVVVGSKHDTVDIDKCLAIFDAQGTIFKAQPYTIHGLTESEARVSR